MLLSLFKLICRYIKCDSHSKCGNREDSDSVKQNHKKRVRKKNNIEDEIELSP